MNDSTNAITLIGAQLAEFDAEARRVAEEAARVERERVIAQRAAEAEAARLAKIEADRIAAERAAADAALEKVRAAAPLLLEALRDCVALIERDMPGDRTAHPELTAARAAIAAATTAN